MDEAMEKGYGIGSGVSLFICVNICTEIIWKVLCPFMITTISGSHFVGILIAIPHILATRPNKLKALWEILFREQGLSNLLGIMSTLLMFLVAIYFNHWKVELPLKNDNQRSHGNRLERYTIKFLYTSSTPIMLHATSLGNLQFISQILYTSHPRHALIKMLGVWRQFDNDQTFYPVSGMIYYLTPPRNSQAVLNDPLHTLIYAISLLSACSIFSMVV